MRLAYSSRLRLCVPVTKLPISPRPPKIPIRADTRVYIDYGDSAITASQWDTYIPSPGYIKNTPRNAEFNQENTFSSPGLPNGQVIVSTIDYYTWKFIRADPERHVALQ